MGERSSLDVDLNNENVNNAEYIYQVDTSKLEAEAKTENVATMQDTKDDKESYHGNINTEMWLKWLEARLIPAFQAQTSVPERLMGRKMILVMDNATYHTGKDDQYKSPSRMNKEELAAKLKEYGITSFSVERKAKDDSVENLTFSEETYTQRGSRTTPMVKEMKTRLQQHLKDHPDLVRTRTKEILEKDDRQWGVLFTPPLEPECQPIELLWGMVKNNVAEQYQVGRTVAETREQLLDAFYSFHYPEKEDMADESDGERKMDDDDGKAGVQPHHCKGMIRKCVSWMNRWIEEHPKLLVGRVGEDDFAIRGDITAANWDPRASDVDDEEEEDEDESELVDHEARLQLNEDEAESNITARMEALLGATHMDMEVDGESSGWTPSPAPPSLLLQSNPLARTLHPAFMSGGMMSGGLRVCYDHL